jgi:hypothetical protein
MRSTGGLQVRWSALGLRIHGKPSLDNELVLMSWPPLQAALCVPQLVVKAVCGGHTILTGERL